jgi:ribosomal protein L29
MKKKEKQLLFDTDINSLQKQSRDIKQKLTLMKVSIFTKPLKNTREMKNLRQKLAVIQTVIRNKEMNHE